MGPLLQNAAGRRKGVGVSIGDVLLGKVVFITGVEPGRAYVFRRFKAIYVDADDGEAVRAALILT